MAPPISRLFIDLPFFQLHKTLSEPHSIQFHPNYIIHWEKKWTSESVKHAVRRNQSRPNWLWHVIVHASSEEPGGTWEVSKGQIRANNFIVMDIQRYGTKLEIFNKKREKRDAVNDLVRSVNEGSCSFKIKEHKPVFSLSSLHTCHNIIPITPLKGTLWVSLSFSTPAL